MRTKTQNTRHINIDYTNVNYIEFDTEHAENTKSAEIQKPNFQKKSLEKICRLV